MSVQINIKPNRVAEKMVWVDVADRWSKRVMTLSREISSVKKFIVTTNDEKSAELVVVRKFL